MDTIPPWHKFRNVIKNEKDPNEIDSLLRRLVFDGVAAAGSNAVAARAMRNIENYLTANPEDHEAMVSRLDDLESAQSEPLHPYRLFRLKFFLCTDTTPGLFRDIQETLIAAGPNELSDLYKFCFVGQYDRWSDTAVSRRKYVLGLFLERYSLPLDELWGAWSEGSSDVSRDRYVVENMNVVAELEQRVPGGVSYLNKTFFIRNFARFTIDVLEDQARNREFSGRCVLVLYAQEDRGGALVASRGLYRNLRHLIRRVDAGSRMVCFEAASNKEILKMFITLEKLYGKDTKGVIQTMIFEGHGAHLRAWLSGKHNELISKFDFITDKFAKAYGRFQYLFAAHAPIYLGYCESGKGDTSAAQALANATGRPIQGTPDLINAFGGFESDHVVSETLPGGGIVVRPIPVEGEAFIEFHRIEGQEIRGDRDKGYE